MGKDNTKEKDSLANNATRQLLCVGQKDNPSKRMRL